MRRTKNVALAFAVAAAVAGCETDEVELNQADTQETAEMQTAEDYGANGDLDVAADYEADRPADADAVINTDFAPSDNANVSGEVHVFPQEGATADQQGFQVQVAIQGLSQGEHAWHIHDGPCGEQAPIVLAMTSTPDMEGIAQPITVQQQDGMTRASATVPGDRMTLQELQSGQYSLHIHRQAGEQPGGTTACANLSANGGGTMTGDNQGTTGGSGQTNY